MEHVDGRLWVRVPIMCPFYVLQTKKEIIKIGDILNPISVFFTFTKERNVMYDVILFL
jgi:hypothetical protein